MHQCSDDNWYDTLQAFDGHYADPLRMPRAPLEDVLRCHAAHVPGFDPKSVLAMQPRANSTTLSVKRSVLYEVLKAHQW